MGTFIRHPEQLPPAELDYYLAMGWRPAGQSIYSADFIQLSPGELISVLPTRLPLDQHRFSKRMRKLMRRNQRLFSLRISPESRITTEKRRVNELYRLEHPDKSLELIEYHLAGPRHKRIFDTWETEIYFDKRLVAFSFFDVGAESAYSKAGIYDPNFSRYSLGLYSLLEEVAYCKEQDLSYFYPGYVSPSDPTFNYKHRIGDLEYWQLSKRRWRPFAAFDPQQDDPLTEHYQRLEALQRECELAGISTKLYQYPYLDIRFSMEGPSNYLDFPCLLYLKQYQQNQHWIVVYQLETGRYLWLTVIETGYYMTERLGRNQLGRPNYVEPLSIQAVNASASGTEALVSQLLGRL